MTKKYYIFDLDDTLINGRDFCGQTMARSIAFFEPNIDSKSVIDLHNQIRGRTIVELYQAAINKFELKTSVHKLVEKDAEIMTQEFHKIALFEGVGDILEKLKTKNKKLYICTNRTSDSLIKILKHNKLDDYFEEIISCIDRGYKKPEPDCLFEIINKNGGKKEEFVYFGDSEIDLLFAKNAGIDSIIFDQYLNENSFFTRLIDLFLN